jgi:basic amino acid/polyamine antiporter, APA family
VAPQNQRAAGAAPEPGVWATKPAEDLIAETHERGAELKRALGVLDLTALGVGAIVGTGVFVVIGEAISDAGPAVVISFGLAALTCVFSALAYAELASTIPVAGSAYTYTYATLGELVAFVIGWDLLLEWGLAAAAVSVGWGQYFNDLLDSAAGVTLPHAIVGAPAEGGVVNVPALFLVFAATTLLIVGVKESVRVNTAMVFVKIGILALFIVLGATAFDAGHFSPFATEGVGGTVSAAALIFFASIGFDAVATSSEELRRTRPDLPRSFRVPLVPWFPLIGAATCIYLMTTLAAVTWIGFVVWLVLGLVVYALFGYRHSRLRFGDR